ncbi:hypothetical protein J2T55_000823 [Methylohalomonas lacus]|uniref:Uncharacterized protein n=1 Tax=Methylohalomonas lacus TaxID=398773 RepID=A0AAE3HKK1_9GAMM|nr:hypothetical protein [Methylohalomonas lacus]
MALHCMKCAPSVDLPTPIRPILARAVVDLLQNLNDPISDSQVVTVELVSTTSLYRSPTVTRPVQCGSCCPVSWTQKATPAAGLRGYHCLV